MPYRILDYRFIYPPTLQSKCSFDQRSAMRSTPLAHSPLINSSHFFFSPVGRRRAATVAAHRLPLAFSNAGRILRRAPTAPLSRSVREIGLYCAPRIVSDRGPPHLLLLLLLPPLLSPRQHNSPHVVRTEAEERDPAVSPSRRVCGVSEKIFSRRWEFFFFFFLSFFLSLVLKC